MDISAASGLAAAQGLFAGAAQAAVSTGSPASAPDNGSTIEAAQVAVLQKALDMERSLVDILA